MKLLILLQLLQGFSQYRRIHMLFTISSLIIKNLKVSISFAHSSIHYFNFWNFPCAYSLSCFRTYFHIFFSFSGFDNSHSEIRDFIFEHHFLLILHILFFITIKLLPLCISRIWPHSVSMFFKRVGYKIGFFGLFNCMS